VTDTAQHIDAGQAAATRARPCYLALDGEAVFAWLHMPAHDPRSTTGVVICPPFGWDELGVHRCLRVLADQFAAAGHAALRYDFPGTGDSAGSPRDPGRLDAWTTSVDVAAQALREEAGCERIVALGIGLGGMVAVRAVGAGAAVDDLVLWAVPSRGRRLIREMRQFARIADAELLDHGMAAEEGEEEVAMADDGALNVAGFVLGAETLAALESLDLAELAVPDGSRRRALLLGRDSLAPDARLSDHLAARSVALTVTSGPGYDTAVVDPHLSEVPWETIHTIVGWVSDGDELLGLGPASSHGEPPLAESVELQFEGAVIREWPFEFDFDGHRLAGIVTEPVSGPEIDLCAVLLNAGALRHIGPHRMWVEAARRWAARGLSTLRFDVVGVGDSDGEAGHYARRGAFQRVEFAAQVIASMDALERAGVATRFLLGGVCSGAYWSLHAALRDDRVDGLLLLNMLAFNWTPELGALRDARRTRALLQHGEVGTVLRIAAQDRWRITRMLSTKLRAAATLRRPESRPPPAGSEVVETLDGLRERDIQVLLLLSAGEPLYDDFVADGLIERLGEWPNLTLERIPTNEHVFSLITSQRRAHELLDAAVTRTLLERAGR
jgi:alpha-beta hydrolase superfamily lysophospholipase